MADATPRALEVLEQLNRARYRAATTNIDTPSGYLARHGDLVLAAQLEQELGELDRKGGYDREKWRPWRRQPPVPPEEASTDA